MVDNNWLRYLSKYFRRQGAALVAAIAFYTCLPVPISGSWELRPIARLAPAIGLMIGGILGVADAGLEFLGMPVLTRSAVVVLSGITVTGGLHLDGAMDAADGLAVGEEQRRLEVMAVGGWGRWAN